jgi:uncharacterized protein (TIGR04222 family)
MLDLAAPEDTWGIAGQDFLNAYIGALAVFVVAAIALRIAATRGSGDTYPPQPTPNQVALLEGGPARAVYAALAGLRAAGIVEIGELRQLMVTGPAPAGLSRLDHAVYDAARRNVQVRSLEADPAVRSALAELADAVGRAGWVVEASRRSRARLGAWLVLGLAVFGLVRIAAGIANDRDVLYLVALASIAFVAGIYLLQVPRRSAAGRRAVATVRSAHGHLAPSQAPAWATYGLSGAAMGVALYGTTSLWAADPEFAEQAGIRQGTDTGSSGAHIGGCGGDSGGGDSGGGGCGGGCGG